VSSDELANTSRNCQRKGRAGNRFSRNGRAGFDTHVCAPEECTAMVSSWHCPAHSPTGCLRSRATGSCCEISDRIRGSSAPMGADDRPATRQPHPHAAGLRGVKCIEHALEMRRIEARPGIAYCHKDSSVVLPGADIRVFNAVRDARGVNQSLCALPTGWWHPAAVRDQHVQPEFVFLFHRAASIYLSLLRAGPTGRKIAPRAKLPSAPNRRTYGLV
jgi:hypothetical protein